MKASSEQQPLDQIDSRIIRLLQAEGRMSNADIAKRVNTSAATCLTAASSGCLRTAPSTPSVRRSPPTGWAGAAW